MNRRELEQTAINAADRCLKTKGYISAVDVLMELGKLSRQDYERWRFRQVPFLATGHSGQPGENQLYFLVSKQPRNVYMLPRILSHE